MLIECVGVGWVQRASLFVRWWSWSGTLNLCALLSSHYLGSYGLVTRWVTWHGRKDAHRRCVQRMLEVLRIFFFPNHFQMWAAGPAGWMIFKCPEPLNPTLTEPVAGLYSSAACIKRGFPLLWA